MHQVPEAPIKLAETFESNDITDQFKLNHSKFASLGTADDFSQMSDHLISIDIQPMLNSLHGDSYFEVSLPVTGMADFLSTDSVWDSLPQQFPSVIALNGFGAQEGEVDHANFPRPHYIMVTDLIGNEYEVLLDAQGHVQVPEEGAGLFSVLSSITLMYSADQVLKGDGFASLQDAGAHPGMLYLLPPPGAETHFTPTLRVSHLDDNFQKVVDLEHKVGVEVHDTSVPQSEDFTVRSEILDHDLGSMLHMELLGHMPSTHNGPAKVQLSFSDLPDGHFDLQNLSFDQNMVPSLGWNQINDTTFEKLCGLSDYAKLALVRDVYSEVDFIRSLLAGDDFGISHQNHFNDFGLRSEAIGPYYDVLVDGVVHNKIPADTLFSHVPEQNLVSLDLAHAQLDGADQQVVDQIMAEFQHHDFSALNQLFLSDDHTWMEDLYLTTDQALHHLPEVSLNVAAGEHHVSTVIDHHDLSFPDMESFAVHSAQGLGGFHEHDPLASSLQAAKFGESLDLAPGHQATTIHYQDVVDAALSGDVIKGFDFQQDKIDLSVLLSHLPGATKDNVHLDMQGDNVHISISDTQSGELHPIATLVGAPHDLHGDDLSHIIVVDI